MEEIITESLQQIEKFEKEIINRNNENNSAQATEVWEKVLRIIKDNVDPSSFKVWFQTITPKYIDDKSIKLVVPSQFFYEWLEEHYSNLLHITLKKITKKEIEILYEIKPVERKNNNGTTLQIPSNHNFSIPPNIENGNYQTDVGYDLIDSQLNPNYVFDNFVISESNQVAAAAAKSVADNPTKTRYNPLLIYGSTGLGKTHLAHSIGNQILARNPRMKVLYTNGEQFYVNFVNAIQSNKISDFARVYRNVDVLIIDDIQFFAGKEKTQDNFFHTFNALHQSNKLIILTSDKPTKELKGVDNRLISRFNSGVTVDIQSPDLDMRMAILKRKSRADGYDFPNEIVEFLARTITDSIRELEGAYISLIAHSTFNNKPLSLDLAKEVLNNIYQIQEKELTVDSIKQIVANHYKITLDMMMSKSRKHEIVLSRQMSMYFTKKLLDYPLKKIGEYFGGKDHTTVLHSIQTIENYLAFDRVVRKSYEIIYSNLKKEHGLDLELNSK
jgi:chromosomal replication initiator protein